MNEVNDNLENDIVEAVMRGDKKEVEKLLFVLFNIPQQDEKADNNQQTSPSDETTAFTKLSPKEEISLLQQ
jgi:acylphosphatase